MFTGQTLLYLVYAMVGATGILVVQFLYMQISGARKTREINSRLQRLSSGASQEEALRSILRDRGLNAKGDYAIGLVALNRLYMQAGMSMPPLAFVLINLAIAFVVAVVLLVIGVPLTLAAIFGFVTAVALPLLVLRRKRTRRQIRFEHQLPDALDMIIRSLRAGHPTNIALGLVAREMPDPIGSEFGLVADEISFGSDIETAISNMSERVGTESLRLLRVAISIQAKTGGNLTEILSNMSKVLRDRVVLKMKIRSLAAEGKTSAIMLSAFPLFMFAILQVIAPSFYGEIWGSPIVIPTFLAFGALALLGIFIMYRMVKFDF